MSEIGPPRWRSTWCWAANGSRGSQLIKQADVLMLHHLVPDEVVPGFSRQIRRLLRAPHRPRQLAVAGDLRVAACSCRETRNGPWSCSGWLLASTWTISPAPPPGACTWPPWAGSGRRWRTDFSGCGRKKTFSLSTLASRRHGRHCNCAFGSVEGESTYAPNTTRSPFDVIARSTCGSATGGCARCGHLGHTFTITDSARSKEDL